jgi:hypothetical protein
MTFYKFTVMGAIGLAITIMISMTATTDFRRNITFFVFIAITRTLLNTFTAPFTR